MQRRSCLVQLSHLSGAAAWLLGGGAVAAGPAPSSSAAPAAAAAAAASAGLETLRWATSWCTLPAAEGRFHAGVLAVDPGAARPSLRLLSSVALPGRAHGLVALPDGGYVVVANRPGRWLLRADAAGQARAWHRLDDEQPARTLNGHAEADADGRWLFTTETDPHSGEGWVSVRDARSLARVLQWRSGGIDPHQCLLDDDGGLLVANGGIARWPDGRKREGEPMAASLARLDARSGRLLARWTLADPALSLRHLAWAWPGADGARPRLGVALQAEHAQPEARRAAPLLALWDGRRLALPEAAAPAAARGYAGDIAAAPGGGFVLSGQKGDLGLWWRPGRPDLLQPVAQWREPCALAGVPRGHGRDEDAVLIAGAPGLALWRAGAPAWAAPWPGAWAPDNHLVLLDNPS